MTDAETDNGTKRTDSRFAPCGRRSGPPTPEEIFRDGLAKRHSGQWFVVWTRPGREAEAQESLTREGFPNFFPRHEVALANRQKRVEFLFPRYGFSQTDFNSHWVPILSLSGVSAILRSPFGAPKHLPQRIVDKLIGQTSADGVIYPEAPEKIERGDALRAVSGPFAEFTGICSRVAKDRIWILMQIMNGEREIEFDRKMIEAV